MKRAALLIGIFLFALACANGGGHDAPPRDICDLNGDGVYSFLFDTSVFFNAFPSDSMDDNYVAFADMNNDGAVTTLDYGIYRRECLSRDEEG